MAATAIRGDVPRTGNQGIDALISPWRWNATTLTYSFPAAGSAYDYGPEAATFARLTSAQASAAKAALAAVASFTTERFTKVVESPTNHADLRFAMSAAPDTAYAFLPGPSWGGDAWFNKVDYAAPTLGTYASHTFFHETGHAMGLKHGHEAEKFGRLPADLDSLEFSIMTYHGYVGSTTLYQTYADDGAPQGFMMLDIAALQHMYGADFGYRSGETVYRFSPTTGEMLVNGARTGDPAGDTIFRTIWDGGGIDTFDLRNYATNLRVDLAPGGWSLFAGSQRANLGDGHLARGNVFNALLYEDNPRSLIENVSGGTGNDVIRGNTATNILKGGLGKDSLFGLDGNDTLAGGAGADRLNGGAGDDVLTGGAGSDTLIGGADNDALAGGDGNDSLSGSEGDDALSGGDGADTLDGGNGTDSLDGGAGLDVAVFSDVLAAYSVTTLDGVPTIVELSTLATDTLIGIESVRFADGLVPI
ncbi:MAG: M10 family metallopeptidase C-terminal domain-containing protein [Hyphomicrobiaceae bacterium]